MLAIAAIALAIIALILSAMAVSIVLFTANRSAKARADLYNHIKGSYLVAHRFKGF